MIIVLPAPAKASMRMSAFLVVLMWRRASFCSSASSKRCCCWKCSKLWSVVLSWPSQLAVDQWPEGWLLVQRTVVKDCIFGANVTWHLAYSVFGAKLRRCNRPLSKMALWSRACPWWPGSSGLPNALAQCASEQPPGSSTPCDVCPCGRQFCLSALGAVTKGPTTLQNSPHARNK